QGFAAGDIQWPTPARIPFGPLMSYGYENWVALPITIAVPQNLPTDGNITLAGHANWLVCSNVCVPEEADIKLVLPSTTGPAQPDPANAADFAAAQAQIPADNPFTAAATYDKDNIRVHVATGDAGKLTDVAFFPLDEGVINN